MNTAFNSIDEYIYTQPANVQAKLQKIRKIIAEAAPSAVEAISYQMPTFKLNGNLVHFAAFKNHIGFYPIPSGIEVFKEELKPYTKGKGSVQFQLNEDIPYDLIRKIVLYRVRENLSKSKVK